MLWLWCRQAAVAPIGPLAREAPYAVGAALKRKKGEKKERERVKIGAETECPTPKSLLRSEGPFDPQQQVTSKSNAISPR